MVAIFMFYSGYGVMESIKKKGTAYISKMPKNRILSTLFNFDLAILLFYVLSLILGKRVGLSQLVLSFIGWESIGNSNWYIFSILILYLLTYIIFYVTRKKSQYVSFGLLAVFVCVLIVVTDYYQLRPQYWYDTMLCYVFGVGYSLYKEYIEKWVCKHIACWVGLIILLVALYFIFNDRGTIGKIAANLLFAAAVVVFTMHITLKNRALVWCGKHLFEIYILQRIPMIIFKELGIADINKLVYFVLCGLCTAILVIGFTPISNKLWSLVSTMKGVQK